MPHSYQVDGAKISVLAQHGNILDVNESGFANHLVSSVDSDGNPIIVNATGPGEAEAQALLSSLKLGAAILFPIARSNLRGVLFAARDASVPPFRGADLEMFLVLTRQALVALENARLYADLRSYVKRWNAGSQQSVRMNIRLPGFVSFLFQRSRSVMAAMVCVGVLSGLCSAGVLALINRVLQQRHDQEAFLALGFVAVVAGKLATQIVSQLTLTRFAQDTTLDLSLDAL